MGDNLTKENFWNEMQQKYPDQMKKFCSWIDEYKKKNDWNSLFPIVGRPKHWMDIKYHHLPLAMQMGIFNEYCEEYSFDKCKAEIQSELRIDLVANDYEPPPARQLRKNNPNP